MSETSKRCIGESQCQGVGAPPPKTWNDYESGCKATYGGGYQTDAEREIFRHGMATVFSLLRNEFPTPVQCKAAPDLLAACKAAESVMAKHVYPQPDKPDSPWGVLKILRAAIAKVEGARP